MEPSTHSRCSVFVATSLDGFIARNDGSIDWLNEANKSVPLGEDCGFGQFISSIDALVMGRNTFELVLSFGGWPYGDKPVVVMSRSLRSVPNLAPSTVTLSSEPPRQLIARLSDEGLRHLYVDGGLTIQSFIAEGLIDEVTITRIPLLIGAGKPLFGEVPADVYFKHLSTLVFEFGFVQSKYAVRKVTESAPG